MKYKYLRPVHGFMRQWVPRPGLRPLATRDPSDDVGLLVLARSPQARQRDLTGARIHAPGL